ncbi:hypothetical protein BH24ACT13_BH24ACT13_12040 [soil metagenome]
MRRVGGVRLVAALALPLAGAILLAGCTPPGSDAVALSSPGALPEPTPPSGGELDRLIAAADLEPCPRDRRGEVPAVSGGLPAVRLDCLGEGPAVTLSKFARGPAVVSVWASWCPPCAREAPLLQEVADQAGTSLSFLGVDLLDRRDAGLEAAAAFGLRFPSVEDPDGQLRSALGLPGPPVTLFVQADGRVVYRKLGELTSAAELRELIERHLGVRVRE